MRVSDIRNKLTEKGLKVTPQRVAILEAVITLNNHPTAENIIDFIEESNPNIAIATVYKVLEILVQKGLIRKVTTDREVMRYDSVLEKHHHLYCSTCELIEDYIDPELDMILNKYFEKKAIKGFKFETCNLQIRGTFDTCNR